MSTHEDFLHEPNIAILSTVDKKGRPLWNMPKPMYMLRHFKNLATRRQAQADGRNAPNKYEGLQIRFIGRDSSVLKNKKADDYRRLTSLSSGA